ncbi:mau2 chromatid cohesion factor [Halocaridina rubra]|uniref:Cohesin loading complex subunit SCC4 homolog n=1 Tax=Halocaridina rubra TaxID=373956 RepID=A0AAN8WVU1_HALRR
MGVSELDYASAGTLLQMGLEYCHIQGVAYNQLLFLLSKIMVFLLEGRSAAEVQALLNQANQSVEQYNGAQGQKEHLRVFYLVLLVVHNLNSGQVKSVKPALKQLQQSIQNITQLSENEVNPSSMSEMFAWLPRDQLCVLVYLVSVMHSMQAGYMEKAQKYTDKALLQIDKLKAEDNASILSSLQLMLLEHNAMCHLIIGSKTQAIKEISKVCQLLQEDSKLLQAHRAQLHTLLAVYSMSMNNSEAAEIQFNAALRVERFLARKRALEKKGLKVNPGKTELMVSSKGGQEEVNLQMEDGTVLSQSSEFNYLGSVLAEEGGTEKAVRQRVKEAWYFLRQENTFKSQNDDIQDSGQACTAIWGRSLVT